jgi:phage gpG-like protein
MRLSHEFDAAEALAYVDRLLLAIGDPEEALLQVAPILRSDVLAQFQAGGNPAWRPLAPSTVAQKRRQGYPRLNRKGQAPSRLLQRGQFGPHNILMRTGELLSSWTDASDPHHIERVERGELEFGSSLPRALYHQEGRGVPRRPVRITDEAQKQIAEALGPAILKEAS